MAGFPAHRLTAGKIVPATANKAFLHNVPLFKDVSERHLDQLESISEERSLQKNEVVCRLQETGNFYVVREGTVKVGVQDRHGKEIILYLVRPGEFLGEGSLFEGCSQLGIATALGPCRILEVLRERFMEFAMQHPKMLLEMFSTVSLRLHRAEQMISRLVFADAYEKVASVLTEVLDETKTPLDPGVEIPLPLSHKQLASLVGVSRETFTRIMTSFQKAGVIRIKSHRIAVVNPRRLRREAGKSGYA